MKKIILLLSIFITGCSISNYNTPFINTKETTQLEFGMSRESVIKKIGKPLFVSSGGNDKVVWVYEVRTISVASIVAPTGEITPRKTHTSIKHSDPVNQVALIFHSGELSAWGDYALYDPNHENGFYFDCYPAEGCEGDFDECGNCQPPTLSFNFIEEDEVSKPVCCGENLYLIDENGNVTIEGDK